MRGAHNLVKQAFNLMADPYQISERADRRLNGVLSLFMMPRKRSTIRPVSRQHGEQRPLRVIWKGEGWQYYQDEPGWRCCSIEVGGITSAASLSAAG